MGVGKRVGDEIYVHRSSVRDLADASLHPAIEQALERLDERAREAVNVVKINTRSQRVGLLSYPDFEEDPFPALAFSWSPCAGRSPLVAFRWSNSAGRRALVAFRWFPKTSKKSQIASANRGCRPEPYFRRHGKFWPLARLPACRRQCLILNLSCPGTSFLCKPASL